MRRIKIIDSNQGNGGVRIQDEVWQRLISLDDGYFQSEGSIYYFYTSDGLLIRAVKNSDDFMAKRFATEENELFVDYCEPGLGISIIEQTEDNPEEFLFRDTGYYSSFGKSFFIKFKVVESRENSTIPSVWSFQTSCNGSKLEIIKHFLFNSIFHKPLLGELHFKTNEIEETVLIFEGKYYRKLLSQMQEVFKKNIFDYDTSWYNIYYGLKSAKPIKEYMGFNILTQ